ncbi:MAG: FecR family protein [Marinilabiliaceae bacterium]|nr:FecR family protein [Marinilabiliaceae bacterium]
MALNDKNNIQFEKCLSVYSNIYPTYSKSKHEVWKEIESKMEKPKKQLIPFFAFQNLTFRYAIAATLMLLIGTGLFMRFYSETITTIKGEHANVLLPDGSEVSLNALSNLNYQPYWWWIERNVKLNGEGFFKVKKGERFTVYSDEIKTQVLGTSFNVYSREGNIEVACITGKVKVSGKLDEIILLPNEKAELQENKKLTKNSFENEKEINAWIASEFYYESSPLSQVFDDLELQFNVEFEFDSDIQLNNLKYSGFFKKNHSFENILNLVCKPFGFKFNRTEKGKYHLYYDK